MDKPEDQSNQKLKEAKRGATRFLSERLKESVRSNFDEWIESESKKRAEIPLLSRLWIWVSRWFWIPAIAAAGWQGLLWIQSSNNEPHSPTDSPSAAASPLPSDQPSSLAPSVDQKSSDSGSQKDTDSSIASSETKMGKVASNQTSSIQSRVSPHGSQSKSNTESQTDNSNRTQIEQKNQASAKTTDGSPSQVPSPELPGISPSEYRWQFESDRAGVRVSLGMTSAQQNFATPGLRLQLQVWTTALHSAAATPPVATLEAPLSSTSASTQIPVWFDRTSELPSQDLWLRARLCHDQNCGPLSASKKLSTLGLNFSSAQSRYLLGHHVVRWTPQLAPIQAQRVIQMTSTSLSTQVQKSITLPPEQGIGAILSGDPTSHARIELVGSVTTAQGYVIRTRRVLILCQGNVNQDQTVDGNDSTRVTQDDGKSVLYSGAGLPAMRLAFDQFYRTDVDGNGMVNETIDGGIVTANLGPCPLP